MTDTIVGPEEVAKIPTTALPARRDLILKRPGNINYAAENGSFAGCRVVTFGGERQWSGMEADDDEAFKRQGGGADGMSPVDQLNLYFKHRANLTVVAIIPTMTNVTCIFTNFMEGEELEDFQMVTEKIQGEMDKLKAEREEKKAKDAEAKQAKEKEDKALIELGRKAKEHNLVEKLRDMTEKYEEVKKLVAKYEKAEKKGGKK